MNMNNMNLSDDKMAALLKIASKKLGRDASDLQADLEAGKMDNVLSGLNPKAAGQINNLLQNPDELQAVLNSDKVKTMLNGLLGGQK